MSDKVKIVIVGGGVDDGLVIEATDGIGWIETFRVCHGGIQLYRRTEEIKDGMRVYVLASTVSKIPKHIVERDKQGVEMFYFIVDCPRFPRVC